MSDLPREAKLTLSITLKSTMDTTASCSTKQHVLFSGTVTALPLHARVVWWKADMAKLLAAVPGCDKFR